ncbi:hypothetical protein R1flu_015566 [Riccia fluitans]|uniref:Phosphoenolpyruvate carboxykinase n=1 Tax=Riccia fluitans TaxID=41844 RepID=A0ABD1YK57_9MARC
MVGEHGVVWRCVWRWFKDEARRTINAIHDGSRLEADFVETPIFNLHVPKEVYGVPTEILWPENTWKDKEAYNESLRKLGDGIFSEGYSA